MTKHRLLDLFSGIGGFSLGLERSGGFETVAFCEIEDYPRKVLARHWPEVPCYDDIRELTAERLAADGITVDAICGGFPCQDISNAGKGAGIEGERSGLWSEYARLIGELRPAVVFVENVSALLGRGMGVVCGDLAAMGYDAEWGVIRASDIGAPHHRARLWIVAYPQSVQCNERKCKNFKGEGPVEQQARGSGSFLAHPNSVRQPQSQGCLSYVRRWLGNGSQEANVADADSQGLQRRAKAKDAFCVWEGGKQQPERCGYIEGQAWRTEPDVGRVADGVPARSHRLKALGNAVVPQIPELLGRAWMEATHER